VQPTMYPRVFWTMRQLCRFLDRSGIEPALRYLLDQGTNRSSIASICRPRSATILIIRWLQAKWGKSGAIDSLADMEILFDRIPLDKVSTSMTSTHLLHTPCHVCAVGEKQGWRAASSGGRYRTIHPQGIRCPAEPISFRPRRGLRLITDISSGAPNIHRILIPFPSPAITSGRPGLPLFRKWRSPWPMA